MLKRILGIAGISLVFSMLFHGVCSFFAGNLLGLYYFLMPCFFVLALLSSCMLLYSVNKTLWNAVHDAHEKKNGILCMVPDLYVIVEFVDYVSRV